MICRDGVVVDGSRDAEPARARRPGARLRAPPLEELRRTQRPVRWALILGAIVAVMLVLACLPGRAGIAPLIESDYCYLLIAADRMYEGLGLTAPLPVAPFQSWTWKADWSFLTQWPIGYPFLICAVRWLSGLTTIQACQWISVAACAAALVGWFVWVRRNVPGGVTGTLLAAVAAGCSVSTASLINPSTDLLLVAVLPFVLLLTAQAIEHLTDDMPGVAKRRGTVWLALAGLMAGGLFWIRYASVFVPLAVGLFLLVHLRRRRKLCLRSTTLFALFAAVPIAALLLINDAFGMAASVQAQLNLGHATRFDLSPQLFGRAWWNFTDLGFYDHHLFTHWVYSLWPVGVCVVALIVRPARRAVRSFFASPGVALSALVVIALLVMIVGATAAFSDKYNYVGLDRYYTPGKPFYFLLFIAPIILIRRRIVRAFACVAFLVACSWLIQQEWSRPYEKWLAANREVTPYGQWARCFTPDAAELYRWLGKQDAPNLVVVSNFHEYIALETGIPALPIPKDAPTLNTWVKDICRARGITDPQVLFVLDPDNRWRDYWIPDPTEIIQTFGLENRIKAVPVLSTPIYEYATAS